MLYNKETHTNKKKTLADIARICAKFSIAICIVILITVLKLGVNLGSDFTGGVGAEIACPEKITIEDVRASMMSNTSTQSIKDNNHFMIVVKKFQSTNTNKILENIKLKTKNMGCTFLGGENVGPQIGRELTISGCGALIASIIAIFTYVAFRFGALPAFGGILALIHDLLAVIGFFAVSRIEFTSASVAAMLTVIGYSINDTVVMCDRLRKRLRTENNIDEAIEKSIKESFFRAFLTSFTTLVAAVCLLVFAKKNATDFAAAMIIGIISGTYSSVFLVPLFFQKKETTITR